MTASNLWDQVLARIETKVNRHSFYTWFKPTAFLQDDGTTLTVGAGWILPLAAIPILIYALRFFWRW